MRTPGEAEGSGGDGGRLPELLGLDEARRHGAVVSGFASDVKAHHRTSGAAPQLVGHGHSRAHRVGREVDDYIEPLRWGDLNLLMTDRPIEQPDIAPDLYERRAVTTRGIKREPVSARIRGIEKPEPVASVGDFQDWPGSRVHEDHVAHYSLHKVLTYARRPSQRRVDGGVEQSAVLCERSVAEHQRDVSISPGQRQRVLLVVVDEEEPGQSSVDLRSREVHSVVVVPECRGRLVERIDVVPLPMAELSADS